MYVGLPGSGKTHYLMENYSEHLPDVTHPSFRYGKSGLPEVVAELFSGRDVVAEDSYYCCKNHRNSLKDWLMPYIKDLLIEWKFFENKPEICFCNIFGDVIRLERREHRRFCAFFNLYQDYTPDEDCLDQIPVHHTYSDDSKMVKKAKIAFQKFQKLLQTNPSQTDLEKFAKKLISRHG
jgi:hypothetical protein